MARANRTQAERAVFGVGGTNHGVGRASAVPTVGTVDRERIEVVRGVDEESFNPTIPDMTTSDSIQGVLVVEFDTGNTQSAQLGGAFQPFGNSGDERVMSIRHRNIGDFVAGSGVMTSTANKEDNTGNVYIVFWTDKSYSATDYVPAP